MQTQSVMPKHSIEELTEAAIKLSDMVERRTAGRILASEVLGDAWIAVLRRDETWDETRGMSFQSYVNMYAGKLIEAAVVIRNPVGVNRYAHRRMRLAKDEFRYTSLQQPIGDQERALEDIISGDSYGQAYVESGIEAAEIVESLPENVRRIAVGLANEETFAEMAAEAGVSRQALEARWHTGIRNVQRSKRFLR